MQNQEDGATSQKSELQGKYPHCKELVLLYLHQKDSLHNLWVIELPAFSSNIERTRSAFLVHGETKIILCLMAVKDSQSSKTIIYFPS